jgi:anaerobic ribonucleoside-triphosphate reductase
MVMVKEEAESIRTNEVGKVKFVLDDLLPKSVENTRGELSPFDPEKIVRSIVEETGLDVAQAKQITLNVLRRISTLGLPMIAAPHIRELVCVELTSQGLHKYRNKYTRLGIPIYDVADLLTNGCNENSNQDFNPESSHTWIADQVMEQFVHLSQLTEEEREFHLTGRMHIHMLRYWDRPFCQEWDLRIILLFGIPPVNWGATARSKPAKNAIVAVTHAAKWLAIIQGEFSGGQGFDNFTAFIAPYLKGLKYKSDDPNEVDIIQVAQCYIFESNQVFAARGGQAPFTSISCTPNIPESLMDVDAIGPGGKIVGKYRDFEEECRLFFRALSDVYAAGDADGKMFAFPKHEVKVTRRGLQLFEEDYKYVVRNETCKMGSTYFLNGVADWIPDDIHSQCCRIILKPGEMAKFCMDPTIFEWKNNFNNMGSMQSVSINLPRAAYRALKYGTSIEQEIDEVFAVAEKVLLKKKALLERELSLKGSKLPFCAGHVNDVLGIHGQIMFDMRKQSLSVGFVGLNECVKALCGKELHEQEGYELGKKILEYLDYICLKASSRNGIKFSLWEQPAESTANSFAKKDLQYMKEYAEKYVLGTDRKNAYYTNSSHIRYDVKNIKLWDIIQKQGDLHPIVKGGVITHIWLGDKTPDPDALWELTKNICKNTNTAYFSYTFDFSYCTQCGLFEKGRIEGKCPKCGASEHKIEWYSKITGYYSRVKRWNEGKQQEWLDRTRWSI